MEIKIEADLKIKQKREIQLRIKERGKKESEK